MTIHLCYSYRQNTFNRYPLTVYRIFVFFLLALIPMISIAAASDINVFPEEKRTGVLTLGESIKIATENNFEIKATAEEMKMAVFARKSAVHDFLPKGYVSYSYTGMRDDPYFNTEAGKLNMSDNNLYHWDVTLIQPLFSGFAIYNHYKMANLAEEIGKLENEQKIMDVIRDVKNAYFSVLLSEKGLKVSKEAVFSLTSHEKDARKYFEEGLIPFNDVLRSRVALGNSIQELERASANARLAKSKFNMLLGRDGTVKVKLEDVDSVTPRVLEFESVVNEAMEKRPMLVAVQLGLETLERAVSLTRSAYYPSVNVVGLYEQNGIDRDATNNDFSNENNSIVKIEAKWNIFELGKVRTDVSKVKHQLAAAREKLKILRNGVRLETEDAYLNLKVSEKNIQTASDALDQARENWRITDLQYRQKAATSTDVLDARIYLSQAHMNYYRALYGYMMALGELERAIGRK